MKAEWIDEEAGRLKLIRDRIETCGLEDLAAQRAGLIARKRQLETDIAVFKAELAEIRRGTGLTKAQLVNRVPELAGNEKLTLQSEETE